MTWRRQLAVILFFAALTVLMTWPLATAPARLLLGTPGDTLIWPWNYSWTRQALLVNHEVPFFSTHAFRPFSVAFLHHTHTFFYGLVYTAGSWVNDNPILWNNLFLFTSFVLAGWGAFLLARAVAGSTPGALLAGVIFAFCSYRLGRATGHMNLLGNEGVPWFLYFMLRGLRENRPRWFIAAGLVFAASAWNEYYHALFIILFVLAAALLAWPLRLAGPAAGFTWRRRARAVAAGLLATAVALLPLVIGLVVTIRTRELAVAVDSQRFYVIPLNYLLPSALHRLWGAPLAELYATGLPGNQGEATVFFGYGAMALAIAGVLARRRSPWLRYFTVCAAMFLMLSFGRELRAAWRGFELALPMPYQWLEILPFFEDFRCPARFGAMVALCAALLAAGGFAALTEPWTPATRRLAAAGLIALALLENWHAPMPTFDAAAPRRDAALLFDTIARDPVPGAVLNLPLTHTDWAAVWMQTFHKRPIVSGFVARGSQEQYQYYNNLDLRGWFRPDPVFRRVIDDPLAPSGLAWQWFSDRLTVWDAEPGLWTPEKISRLLYFFDLRYLLITPPECSPDLGGRTDVAARIRTELFPLASQVRQGGAWLGVLHKQAEQFPIVIDGGSTADSFYFIENFALPSGGCRWLHGRKGTVAFRLDPRARDAGPLVARIGLGYPAHSAPGTQSIRVRINGRLVHDGPVAPEWSSIECNLPADSLHEGYNYMKLRTAIAESPKDRRAGIDIRRLSVMVGKIEIDQQAK